MWLALHAPRVFVSISLCGVRSLATILIPAGPYQCGVMSASALALSSEFGLKPAGLAMVSPLLAATLGAAMLLPSLERQVFHRPAFLRRRLLADSSIGVEGLLSCWIAAIFPISFAGIAVDQRRLDGPPGRNALSTAPCFSSTTFARYPPDIFLQPSAPEFLFIAQIFPLCRAGIMGACFIFVIMLVSPLDVFPLPAKSVRACRSGIALFVVAPRPLVSKQELFSGRQRQSAPRQGLPPFQIPRPAGKTSPLTQEELAKGLFGS